MKREILFRGKTINSNEWVESMTIANGTIKRKRNDLFMEISENKWVGVIPETVSQLVFRINGHAFFIGDIITTDKGNLRYVILWNEENQCISTFTDYDMEIINRNDELYKTNILSNKEPLRLRFLEKYGFYPIGNIHDNPELLK